MDLFKVKGFRKPGTRFPEQDSEDQTVPPPEEMIMENGNPVNGTMEEEDDDVIEDDETTSYNSGFRDSEMGDNHQQQFCSFDSSYEKKKELPRENGEEEYLQLQQDDIHTWILKLHIYFEPLSGLQSEIYAGNRSSFTKMLQVPSIKVAKKIEKEVEQVDKEEESDEPVLGAADLIGIVKTSLPTFLVFMKMDKKKESTIRSLSGGGIIMFNIKELRKKKKGWRKKTWLPTTEEVKLWDQHGQLLWCEETMSKLSVSVSNLVC
ncbi:hypothetical protein MKW92_011363 [Papaver armeniacum]|nr:hypothetical protein MKW92_011363 [Papaver armeniacum]